MNLILLEITRSIDQARKQPFQIVTSIVVTLIIFYIVFLTSSASTDKAVNNMNTVVLLSNFLIGFSSFSLIISITNFISNESKYGTLEYLIKSKYGILSILLVRASLIYINSFFQLFLMAIIVSLISKVTLNLTIDLLLPFFSVFVSSCGISLILSGLILFYKDFSGIIPFFQISALASGIGKSPSNFLQAIAPVISSAGVFKQAFIGGGLNAYFLIVFIFSLIYFFIGVIIFTFGLKFAKKLGNLHHE